MVTFSHYFNSLVLVFLFGTDKPNLFCLLRLGGKVVFIVMGQPTFALKGPSFIMDQRLFSLYDVLNLGLSQFSF